MSDDKNITGMVDIDGHIIFLHNDVTLEEALEVAKDAEISDEQEQRYRLALEEIAGPCTEPDNKRRRRGFPCDCPACIATRTIRVAWCHIHRKFDTCPELGDEFIEETWDE